MKKVWIQALRGLLVLLSPLAVVLACQLVGLQDPEAALDWMAACQDTVRMYWGALLLAQLALTGLTRLSGLSGLLTALVPFGLTLVSYYKSVINGEPLRLADLGLAAHLGDIAQFAADSIVITPAVWGALACLVLPFLLLTALDVYSPRFPASLRLFLAGSACALLALFAAAVLRPYCVEQHKAYPLQEAREPRLGVALNLLTDWYCSAPAPSAVYDQARMLGILEDMEGALARQEVREDRPSIIFVMNESFFDLTRLEGLTFSRDPLSNYHRLRGEATWGRFYTTTCGGGTGQVEMEAFTGVAAEELDSARANTDLDPETYQAMPSWVRVLKENGYRTAAFHAHTSELYNRDKNYPHLGFDRVLFREPYMDQATFAGGVFDDDSAANVILSLFEEDREGPVLLYAMTMQNHQPYPAWRYPQPSVEVSCPLLSQEELEGVSSYANGLYDADRMLAKLVDYFSRQDEPVILIFAGDHIPALPLNEEESLYTRLGLVPTPVSTGWSARDYQNMLSTDYIIWSNCRTPQGEKAASATMIGGALLELAGVRSTPFFAWMAQARREAMTFHARLLTVDPEGRLAAPDAPAVQLFRTAYTDVIYDLLYGEGYIAGEINRVRAP